MWGTCCHEDQPSHLFCSIQLARFCIATWSWCILPLTTKPVSCCCRRLSHCCTTRAVSASMCACFFIVGGGLFCDVSWEGSPVALFHILLCLFSSSQWTCARQRCSEAFYFGSRVVPPCWQGTAYRTIMPKKRLLALHSTRYWPPSLRGTWRTIVLLVAKDTWGSSVSHAAIFILSVTLPAAHSQQLLIFVVQADILSDRLISGFFFVYISGLLVFFSWPLFCGLWSSGVVWCGPFQLGCSSCARCFMPRPFFAKWVFILHLLRLLWIKRPFFALHSQLTYGTKWSLFISFKVDCFTLPTHSFFLMFWQECAWCAWSLLLFINYNIIIIWIFHKSYSDLWQIKHIIHKEKRVKLCALFCVVLVKLHVWKGSPIKILTFRTS